MSASPSQVDGAAASAVAPSAPRPKGLFRGWRRRINSSSTLSESWAWRWRLPVSAVVLVGAWIVQCFARPLMIEDTWMDDVFDVAGWSSLAAGMGWRIWAARSISGRKSKEIVAEGAYSVCRNPLYVGTFFIGLATICFLKSYIVLAAWGLVFLLYAFGVVPAEERFLRSKHGAEYEAYCRRVWAWIPSLRYYSPVTTPIASQKSWTAECVRSIWWLALPIALEATCMAREMLPMIWLLPMP